MTDRDPGLVDGLSAGPDFLREEVESALRNHEMPLEALAHDLTPAGLHYVLAHFDIPLTEPAGWGLRIEGAVTRPRTIDLAELQSAQSVTVPVTIECAGNGRADLQPRPIGQPWLGGAVSTAAWTGTRLWPLLDAAGVHPAAVEVAFRGRDHGRDGVVPLAYERSLTVAECQSSGALLAWAMNGRPLDAVHGAPLRLIVPGWYGMASVKWLEAITISRRALQRDVPGGRLPTRNLARWPGPGGDEDAAAGPDPATGSPGCRDRGPERGSRVRPARGSSVVGVRGDLERRGLRRRRRHLAPGRACRAARGDRLDPLDSTMGGGAGTAHAVRPRNG